MRKLAALLLPLVLLAGLVPASGASAAAATVSGTFVSKDEMALGPNAVAMITIVDQQASPDAGVIIGSQRVDGAQLPLAFSVPYDDAEIDPGHSYAIYASITDDTLTLQNVEPVPVITGGPTSGVTVVESRCPRRDGDGQRHHHPHGQGCAHARGRRLRCADQRGDRNDGGP